MFGLRKTNLKKVSLEVLEIRMLFKSSIRILKSIDFILNVLYFPFRRLTPSEEEWIEKDYFEEIDSFLHSKGVIKYSPD